MLANYVPVSMDIVHSSLHISEELQKEELKARAESQARKDGRNGSCRMEFPPVLNIWKAKILRVGELAAAAEAREREASIQHPSGFVVPCVAQISFGQADMERQKLEQAEQEGTFLKFFVGPV